MKNKLILGLILGIFLIGLVSASVTGYLVRGTAVQDSGYTATLQKVEGTTAIVGVKTPEGEINIIKVEEGQTATVGDVQISASDLRRGTLFRRAGAEIKLDASGIGPIPIKYKLTSTNQTNVTCKVCTEKYKVLEGEVQIVQGNSISIDYIDADSTALSVNGAITSDLLEGQTFQLDYGEIVTINDVYGIPQGIRKVELCLSGCYKVLEGEVKIVKGDNISIDYIDVNSAALSVNGAITQDLSEGQTFELSNGQIVTINDVYGIPQGIRKVELCLSSSS